MPSEKDRKPTFVERTFHASESNWRRSSRKRSRRGSQKGRVRVVGRAVTFHGHDQVSHFGHIVGPQSHKPAMPMNVPTYSRQLSSASARERTGSVIEVSPNEQDEDELNTDKDATNQDKDQGDAGDNSHGAGNRPQEKLKLSKKTSESSVTSNEWVMVPANSPAGDSNASTPVDQKHLTNALGKHASSPMKTASGRQQWKKVREAARKRKVFSSLVQRQVDSPTTPTSINTPQTPTSMFPFGDPLDVYDSSPADPRKQGAGSVMVQLRNPVHSMLDNGTETSASPSSMYSSDLPVDMYGTRPVGCTDCPLADCGSSLNSLSRDSPC